MKTKLLALLMALVMIVCCLASCGGNDPEDPDKKPGKNPGPGSEEEYEEILDYSDYWDKETLIFELTDNSNDHELTSGCRRYLAGKSGDDDPLDDKIIDRNGEAERVANVSVEYKFMTDTSDYNWGQNMSRIHKKVFSQDTDIPDIYCNFIYDMVACSLEKCFANLYSTSRGVGELKGANFFKFANAKCEDDGNGYMYEYMTTLTLSKSKMYCLSSNYFTDMVRAFFVVPVHVGALNGIGVAAEAGKFNSDRTNDQKFDIDDFYKLVWDGEWTYETLAAFSNAFGADGDDIDEVDLRDKVGFAISATSGLSASGMLYTSNITIINRVPNSEAKNNYDYSYPAPTDEQAQKLYTYCTNLKSLFDNHYVISVTDAQTVGKGTDSLVAIRNCFSEGTVLFGGVICVGSLEDDVYQRLNDVGQDGFGIVPVPLYQAGDKYLTQIHNIGRIGAISAATTKFAQCSAYLNYLSLHSDDILNDYYEQSLMYDISGGSQDTIDMLDYIRKNVRSSFDKAFEDAIGKFFQTTDKDSSKDKWHIMIMNAGFKLDSMPTEYERVYGKKATKLASLEAEYEGLPD